MFEIEEQKQGEQTKHVSIEEQKRASLKVDLKVDERRVV